MNLLFYLHQFPGFGGIETVTATLANRFKMSGNRVFILSCLHRDVECSSLGLEDGVTVLDPINDSNLEKSVARSFKNLLERYSIDVIIFQDSYSRIEKPLLAVASEIPIVVVEHNSPRECVLSCIQYKGWLMKNFAYYMASLWKSFVNGRIYAKRRRLLYDKCSRYVLLSKRYKEDFLLNSGVVDPFKLCYIANPLTQNAVVSKEPKVNELVFVGTLNLRKGVDILLEIWSRVNRRFSNWKLTVVGDGVQRATMELYANRHNMQNIEFVGYHRQPGSFFSRAKIFLFPSRREGFPMVLLESMANGCVPVCFKSYDAVSDIVRDGVDGALVKAFDIDAITERLASLMSDERRIVEMSDQCRLVCERFSIERIEAEWYNVFKSIGVK